MNWSLFFSYFFRALLDIKFHLLGLFLILAALLTIYLMFEPTSYKTSWVILLPGTERASTINLDNIGEARTNGSNAYGSVSISPKNTYREIALSDAVINTAAEKYGVPASAFSKPKITLIDQTPAIKFSLKGESKEELEYRARLYNTTFHETLDALRGNEIERNFKGVESNLAEAKRRLGTARQDIVDYQTDSSIVSDQQFERWMNDAEQLRTETTTTSVKIAQQARIIETALKQLNISQEQAESLLTLQANPTVAVVLSTLSSKLAEQTSMQSLYAPAHPTRRIIDLEVASLTKQVRVLVNNLPDLKEIPDNQLYGLLANSNTDTIKSINLQLSSYAGLKAQKLALQNSYQAYLHRIKTHSKDAAKLSDLQRAHQIAEAIFSSALAKLDTSRLDIYATYPLTQLLTQPGATIKRDRLQAKLMVVAMCLIFGLLALALTLNRVRQTFLATTETNKEAARKPAATSYIPELA